MPKHPSASLTSELASIEHKDQATETALRRTAIYLQKQRADGDKFVGRLMSLALTTQPFFSHHRQRILLSPDLLETAARLALGEPISVSPDPFLAQNTRILAGVLQRRFVLDPPPGSSPLPLPATTLARILANPLP